MAVYVEFAEGTVPEHLTERRQALAEQFLSVGHEEQRRVAHLLSQATVVERGDDRLSGSSGRNDEASVPMVALSLDRQSLENLGLMRIRNDVKCRNLKSVSCEC